jgi:hypothetical protein
MRVEHSRAIGDRPRFPEQENLHPAIAPYKTGARNAKHILPMGMINQQTLDKPW